jgi:hypothetical protein
MEPHWFLKEAKLTWAVQAIEIIMVAWAIRGPFIRNWGIHTRATRTGLSSAGRHTSSARTSSMVMSRRPHPLTALVAADLFCFSPWPTRPWAFSSPNRVTAWKNSRRGGQGYHRVWVTASRTHAGTAMGACNAPVLLLAPKRLRLQSFLVPFNASM